MTIVEKLVTIAKNISKVYAVVIAPIQSNIATIESDLATVKKQNRVFYGECDTYNSTNLDVYLNTESKERWDSVKNGDMLICRMTQYSVENPELAVYLTSGWTEHMRTACNYNKATGSANSIQAKHWRGGSVIVFVYDETFGGWLAQNLQSANTTYYGLTKLNDSIDSTSTTTAATANAVKTAYDKAVDAVAIAQTLQGDVGDIGVALDEIMEIQKGLIGVAEITFTVDGTQYTAEEGMTWYDFVHSDYNPTDAYGNITFKCDDTDSDVTCISRYEDESAEDGGARYLVVLLYDGSGDFETGGGTITPGGSYYTEE